MSTSRDHDRRAVRQARLDALSVRLEQAVGQLVSGEDWVRAVEFAARFRSRSFTNTLLIYLQHAEAYEQGRVPTPELTYVAGFRQWQQLGRSVIKGQSGNMIRSPGHRPVRVDRSVRPELVATAAQGRTDPTGRAAPRPDGRHQAWLRVGRVADRR